MQFFSRLKIFQKILVVLAIAVLSFVVNLTINITAINKNQMLLNKVQSTSIHLANLTSENVSLWRRLDEVYTQSVSFSDEDLLKDAASIFEHINENLTKMKQLDADFAAFSELEAITGKYNELAVEISSGFINGTIDFQAAQGKIQEKADLFEGVGKQFAQDKTQAANTFNSLIEQTINNSSESRNLSVIVGVSILLLMIVLGAFIAKTISRSVISVKDSLQELAEGEGDLTNQLEINSQDELGTVVKYFNSFTQKLRAIVREVVDVVSPLNKSAEQLTAKVKLVDKNVKHQTELAEVTKQSMIEMQFSVADIAKSAAEAANAANEGETEVNQGMNSVQHSLEVSGELTQEITTASEVINRLAQDSQNMNKILDVINSIAEQTNLLALNAAIEAARAGGHGRGFAVVADEVRNLASRTSTSTTEIRGLLDKLLSAADQSVSSMETALSKATNNESISLEVNTSLNNIKEQIGLISSMNSQIAAATEEQSSVAETVVNNIEEMYSNFGATIDAVSEIEQVAKTLDQHAEKLSDATTKFVV